MKVRKANNGCRSNNPNNLTSRLKSSCRIALKIVVILSEGILKENGCFVLEHQSRHKIEHPDLQETRKYGNVSFSFFTKSENP